MTGEQDTNSSQEAQFKMVDRSRDGIEILESMATDRKSINPPPLHVAAAEAKTPIIRARGKGVKKFIGGRRTRGRKS